MGGKPFGTTPIGSGTHRGALTDKGEEAHPNEAVTERHTVGSVALMKGETMREIIVRYNDGNDHMAVRGGEYVQDFVRCQDCRHWVYNFNGCKRNPCTEPWYATDGCTYGERREP